MGIKYFGELSSDTLCYFWTEFLVLKVKLVRSCTSIVGVYRPSSIAKS